MEKGNYNVVKDAQFRQNKRVVLETEGNNQEQSVLAIGLKLG